MLKNAVSISVSVAFADYSVSAEYSAKYTAKTFGQNHLWSDTKTQLIVEMTAMKSY
jgi:hypothetical protein